MELLILTLIFAVIASIFLAKKARADSIIKQYEMERRWDLVESSHRDIIHMRSPGTRFNRYK